MRRKLVSRERCTSPRRTPSFCSLSLQNCARVRSSTGSSRRSSTRLSQSSPRSVRPLLTAVTAEGLTTPVPAPQGLSPDVLQGVVQPPPTGKGKQRDASPDDSPPDTTHPLVGPRVVYELAHVADHFEPRLRLYLDEDALPSEPSTSTAIRPSHVAISLPIPQSLLQLASSSSAPPDLPNGDGQPGLSADRLDVAIPGPS